MSIIALLLIVLSNILFQLLIYRRVCKAIEKVVKSADENLEQSYRSHVEIIRDLKDFVRNYLKETIWECVMGSGKKKRKR